MKHRHTAGFTLLELILYVAIISIIMMAIIPFAWTVIQNKTKHSSQQEVSSQARLIVYKLNTLIRNSSDITTGSSTFDTNLVTTGQLTLANAVAAQSPTVIDVVSGKIRVKRGVGAAVPLHSDQARVTSLVFTNYSSNDNKTKHVGYVITLEDNSTSTATSYQESITLRSSVELRSN